MRREGRQRGWVCAYDRALVDPEGKRRVVGAVAAPATVANGGFVRAPRKPTNHSKFTGGRAFRELISGKGASGGSVASTTGGKGRHKFKHDEIKAYYLDLEVVRVDDAVDEHRYDMDLQHGWVCAYDRALVDPEGKRRAVGTVGTVGNGGFIRAPRKPTNHSKFTGGRAFRELSSGKGAAGGSTSSTTGRKGRHKVKHDEIKAYYLELEGADDAVDGHSYDMDS
uniref:Uncharacterized protein n=1 Tax=Oryza punctata TaxID=4537 RepID=A0A0E0JJF3_ORYPU